MIWLVLALGLILRSINLNQSLWLDEATQVILSSKPINEIIFNRAADFHPPFSYLLMHFWMKFGTSEIWLRMLSVLFGAATIFITYLFSAKLFNKKIALLSALFLAIAPYHIYYSQEIRMYALSTFFAVCSMYFFISKKRLGYVLSTAALLYTHYLGFCIFFSQIIFAAFRKKEELKSTFVNFFLTILLLLPYFPLFLAQFKGGVKADVYLPGWSKVLSLPFFMAVPQTLLKFSIGRIDFNNQIIYPSIAIVVIILFSFFLILGLKQFKNPNTRIVFYWFFAPLAFANLITIFLPLYQPFRLLTILPAFYIILSLGLYNFTKFKTLFTVILITISISGALFYYINPSFWREDWRGAVQFIKNNATKESKVIFAWPDPFPPYVWYGGYESIGVVPAFPAKKEDVEQKLSVLADKREVFLFEYLQSLSDPQNYIQQILKDLGFLNDRTVNFRGVGFVYHFQKAN